MAITAISTSLSNAHVFSKDTRPPEGAAGYEDWVPTTWHYKIMDSRLLGLLRDKTTKITIDPKNPDGDVGTELSKNVFNFDVCSLGLSEPDNFIDVEGKKVPWHTMKRNIGGVSYTVVDPRTLGVVPIEVLAELADKIAQENEVSAEEGNAST